MGVPPVVRDHKELGVAFFSSLILICFYLGSLVEFNPALNNKTILEHTAAAAAASPVVVSASSDQQIGKIHHPLLDPKQRAAAAPKLNQFPHALPLDQPAVAPLDHDLAAASLFDQPAAGTHVNAVDDSVNYNRNTTLPAAVEGLIRDIRLAALLANGGQPVEPLDEDGKKDWNEKNPCMSRQKLSLRYAARKYAKDVEANPGWDAVFREYQILHQICTRKVKNVSQYFNARDTSSGCHFMVCNAYDPSGLGNKVLITVSCFLYAVLTQRVLLVPSSNILVTDVMCEPFEGSSWKVDQHTIGLPMSPPLWASMQHFLAVLDSSMAAHDSTIQKEAMIVYAADVTDNHYGFQPDNRFFCPAEQIFLRNVTWVNLVGNQYFVPKLFGVPIFRATLEALFPTRLVLTHLLRRLLLPGDPVWWHVEKVQAMQPDRADRRLGVQIRYLGGQEQFDLMHVVVESRIKKCALQNGVLPHHADLAVGNGRRLQSSSSSSHIKAQSINSSAVRRTTVFIASLYDSFEKSLSSDYLQNPPANGEEVTVVQLSNRHDQGYSVEEDVQALTEIILLSLSDDVIITPMSTFGIVAQGYGALRPWFMGMEFFEGPYPPCTEGQTADGCYHVPEKILFCPFDPELHDKSVLEILPYVKDCLPADWPGGIQLITS
jgi:xyloglucan fucosyltransferase